MPIQELLPASAAQQQLDAYNKASGAVNSNSFNLPAGSAWAVVGTLMHNDASLSDIDSLRTVIQNQSMIQKAEELHWGRTPDDIVAGTDLYEPALLLQVRVIETIALPDDMKMRQAATLAMEEPLKPPLGKKFVVWGLKVNSSLDQTGIVAMTTAITNSHYLITSTRHLLDGTIDAEVSENATVTVRSHLMLARK